MRAVVHDRYGTPDVLRLVEVPTPEPSAGEVLVRVHAATVNRNDCGFRSGKPEIVRLFSGLLKPRRPILGTEFAGVVEAVGSSVTRFATGDRVFGVHADRFGAHAEYLCVSEDRPMATMSEAMSFAEAASLSDGFILAASILRSLHIGPTSRLMIYGASGSIGTAGVQYAKHLGAEVTAVCSTLNVELVRSLGADRVIDYLTDDFTAGGETYDAVFDAVGKESFRRCKPLLEPTGIFASTDLGDWCQNPLLVPLTAFSRRKVKFPIPKYRAADVVLARDLFDAHELRAVIDRTDALDEIVEATRYVETEQKVGNVVIDVTPT